MDVTTAHGTNEELARLQTRVERERKARLEAEALAERGLRELYEGQSQLRLLEAVAVAANEASTLEGALEFALDQICTYTGWPIGHACLVSKAGDGTLPTAIWHLAFGERYEEFRRVTEAMPLPRGKGLPGVVLETGKPAWITDVTNHPNFPRRHAAQAVGIRAGFAFPVLIGAEVVAVLEYFSEQVLEPDARLLEIMAHIGAQLGRIAERRRAEDLLREAQERYRVLLDRLPVAVAVHAAGKVVYVNPAAAELVGAASTQEIIGWETMRFIHPNYREKARARLQHIGAGGGALPAFEEKFIRVDGAEIDVVVNSLLIQYQGKPALLTGMTDITERKRAEEEVKRYRDHLEELVAERTAELTASNRELEAFCYSVSHDLRAPLRSIHGFSQAIAEDYAALLDAKGQDYLRRVQQSASRLGQLIDDLLNMSRVTRGEMRRESVPLSELARTVAAELPGRMPGRKGEFRITDGLTAQGDARLLRIVLDNLLGNAWKYTAGRNPAVIEFGSTEKEGRQAFFVRDNGVGFDMTYANKLFQPFQRLHTDAEFEGSGVGLATVQRIIARHGGRIWTEATLGEGATFYFTLP